MTDSSDKLSDSLKSIRAKRGYLLPHHGLMAITSPDLLAGYDQAYTAMALKDRHLSRHHHEAVWLAILIAMRESLATHHTARFKEAGGNADDISAILAVVAFIEGFPGYGFVQEYWQKQLPGWDAQSAYADAFARVSAGMDVRMAQLCAAAVHSCLGQWLGLSWHIKACYAASIAEMELAEALSLAMFPGSVPRFVRAAATWRQLILDGEVAASEDFRTWAELSGQGGYDEAGN